MKNNQKHLNKEEEWKIDLCRRGARDNDLWIRSFGSYPEATAIGTL